MTILMGFNCSDALLVCADTQITYSAIAKLTGSKIFRKEFGNNGVKSAIAISGDMSYGRMVMQHIERRFSEATDTTVKKLREQVEEELLDFYAKHVVMRTDRRIDFQLLLAIWSPDSNKAAMFWTEEDAVNELFGYVPLGAGEPLAHYIVRGKYRPDMDLVKVKPTAIATIDSVKSYVDGCGGFTEIISLTRSGILSQIERIGT